VTKAEIAGFPIRQTSLERGGASFHPDFLEQFNYPPEPANDDKWPGDQER
jgi:hypothetical protein